jgi:hypothetical protein
VLTTRTSSYIVGRRPLTVAEIAAQLAPADGDLADLWTPARIRGDHPDNAAAQRATAKS